MTSVGSILREQRESQGRAIAEIAEELCITQHYLQAIEADDLTGVPGFFFYKNFARQYAAVLGVDAARIKTAIDALSEPEDPQPRPEIRVPNRLVQATNRRHIPDVPLSWSVVGLVVVLARMLRFLCLVETCARTRARRSATVCAGRRRC